MWNPGSLMYLNRLANELDSAVGGLWNSALFGVMLIADVFVYDGF